MRTNLETQMYDGDLANQILENKVFQAVIADMETELVEQWKSSSNAAERESLHKYHKTLVLFKSRIQSTLEQGKLARLEIEHKRSMLEKLGMQPR